jgi:hypothetical protein
MPLHAGKTTRLQRLPLLLCTQGKDRCWWHCVLQLVLTLPPQLCAGQCYVLRLQPVSGADVAAAPAAAPAAALY